MIKAKPIPPCRGCIYRNQDCHSLCKSYISFRKQLDDYNLSKEGLNYSCDDSSWNRISYVVRAHKKGLRNE